MADENTKDRFGTAERDLIALGIATGAIILFVATGSAVLPGTLRAIFQGASGPDSVLVTTLLLNIALVIFGWRRYRQLTIDISERKRAEAHAKALSEVDPLTGCLNRRSMARAAEEVRAKANAEGRAVAFAMIDLDNFKQINDMHGHGVGDAVLVALAERIRDQLPQQAKLARLGGDEFAFIAPFDSTAPERIDDLIIRLYEHVTGQFDLDGITIDATMSVGIATDHDEHGTNPLVSDAGELMHRADIAMYHAKKQGKNRFFWFEPTMENELRFRNELETGIRRGLSEDEFVPYYEQQIDLDSGELVGFEMLARWQSPQLGLVSPEIFIPIAEEMGLIGELSDKLMTQAFADASEWDDSLTLSINISPVQLRDPWFAQKLLKLLVKQGLQPKRLEVEITESCLHSNIGMVRSMITSLRNQGVKISLDDFGTGYSSLEQLRTLPFDRLKIDRTFIGELGNPEGRSKIVDAIISLGRGLNMPITAEGIEDESILETLRSMGHLKGQGYLYGRPETANQVRERLRPQGLLIERRQRFSSEETTHIFPEPALARGWTRPLSVHRCAQIMRVPFIKMHGLGNDFVVLDARTQDVPEISEPIARALADRKEGIGCDQLILLEPSESHDFRMRIFNADGGEVEACGNASRAVALLHGEPATVETAGGDIALSPTDGGATVDMGVPRFDWDTIPLAYAMDTASMPIGWGELENPMAVNVGNPHAIFFVADADAVDLASLGPEIERDPIFPERVNVNVASVLSKDRLKLHVWERGAGLTRACGTGACATVVAAARRKLVGRRTTVTLPGGDLTIEWRDGESIQMTGLAAESFRGSFEWNIFA